MEIPMVQITKEDAQKWANALRSGEYKQAQEKLQNDSGYCCLGVACMVFIPKENLKLDLDDENMLFGVDGDDQPNAPAWLQTINDDLVNKLGKSFINLNDGEGFTFDQIADIIELVYVHGAL